MTASVDTRYGQTRFKPLKANHHTLITPCSNNRINKCECTLIVNDARTNKSKQRDTADETQSLNGKII